MAKVYVGTYKKYNEGNLAGAWLDLSNYGSYAEFVTACKKLHGDERDPELMIQDTEDFPDGLDCMEWLSEQDFNDIKATTNENKPQFEIVDYSEKAVAVIGDTKPLKDALKKLGGNFNSRLSCGVGWIFSKKQEPALRKLLAAGEITETAKPQIATSGKTTSESAEYVQNLKEWTSDGYYLKHNVGAVKINGYYYPLGKPTIENRFCFHDEGADYENYLNVTSKEERLAKYFLAKNLAEYDREISKVESGRKLFVRCGDKYDSQRFYMRRPPFEWDTPDGGEREITAEEKAAILAGLRWGRAQFEKRLNAYLKRYGVSKIHTWTYWADA